MAGSRAATLAGFVAKLTQIASLDLEDREAIERWPTVERRFAKYDRLGEDESSAPSCRVMVSGIAARYRLAQDGAHAILGLYFPGDCIDPPLGGGDREQSSFLAITDLVVARIAASVLQAAAVERPSIGRALLSEMLIDAAISREWLLTVGHRNAQTRLAHLICEIVTRSARRTQSMVDVDFPFTQEQLGDATGLTSVHVNRSLKQLKSAGLVSYGARKITICDYEGLCAAGRFDSSYLRFR